MSTHRKHRRQQVLRVESLEAMTLLSGLPAMGAVVAPALISAASTQRLSFSGTTTGTFVTSQSNPDTGKNYQVTTQGRTTTGTPITVDGNLHSVGFIATGRATGALTVTTARGTLTLDVTGPPQRGFAALPTHFTYKIVGGTGVFLNNHRGSGTLDIVYRANDSTGASGTIKMVFRAA